MENKVPIKKFVKTYSFSELFDERDRLPYKLDDDLVFIEHQVFRDEENIQLFKYPCRIDATVIIYCTNGSAEASVNLHTYTIKRNTLIIIPPNCIIQVNQQKDFTERGVIISSRLMEDMHINMRDVIPLLLQLQNSHCIPASWEQIKPLTPYYNLMKDALREETPFRRKKIQGLLSGALYALGDILYTRISPSSINPLRTRQNHIFEAFVEQLATYHYTERAVSFYAEKLCLTPKYLSRVILDISGRTASEWIDRFVILEAKTLLKHSNMSIQEIAFQLNFPNQSFFGKYFKNHTGMTPGEYQAS